MKKTNLIISVVLTAAVAVLYILYFTGTGTQKSTPAPESGAVTAASGDIVYINMDTLINQYDMYNDLRTELQGKFNAIENDLNKQGRALDNDIQSFQEKLQKGLLTRSQAESMQNELGIRTQEMQNLVQQKQMEMQEEEAVMINRVMDAITTYVAEYNKDRQYSLILTTTAATSTVINAADGLDITHEIVDGLNAEYIRNRNR